MKIPPVDVTQSVAPSQLRHEYALPKTDRWDDETGSERPDASLKGPLFCRVLPRFSSFSFRTTADGLDLNNLHSQRRPLWQTQLLPPSAVAAGCINHEWPPASNPKVVLARRREVCAFRHARFD